MQNAEAWQEAQAPGPWGEGASTVEGQERGQGKRQGPRSIGVREEVPGNTVALVVLVAGMDEVPGGTEARDVRRTEELVLGMAQEMQRAWRTGNCWERSLPEKNN